MFSFMERKGHNCLLSLFFVLSIFSGASMQALAQDNSQAISMASLETELVNINRDDADTIADILDGVGMSKAKAIVEYRELNGDFEVLEDLLAVKGIGENTLNKNNKKIVFE